MISVSDNPMINVLSVESEDGGTLDKHSVLHLEVDSDMDTKQFDPFDQMLTIKLYKWVLFKYIKVKLYKKLDPFLVFNAKN